MIAESGNKRALSNILKILSGSITGLLIGAIAGGGILGVNQYFQETSRSNDPEMQWVVIAAFFGVFGGAIVGACVGLVVGVVSIAFRSYSGKSAI